MSEANLQRQIQRALEARGCIVMKHHASMYTGRGWPDLWVCLPGGRLAVLETKTPIGKATGIQLRKLAKLERTGAVAGLPTSVAEALMICGFN